MRASCFEHRERPLCRELEAEGGWPLLAGCCPTRRKKLTKKNVCFSRKSSRQAIQVLDFRYRPKACALWAFYRYNMS